MGNGDIYYYSGTGNSLHITRQLQKRVLETKIIPIVILLIMKWMILPCKNDLKHSNVICII
ncbi:hypothetical protein GCM10025861_04070 [Methanobacterium petrolearium]|nr:hypothetical protein GCM10025861_04070 [Methanobacterium petrolearium]